MNDPINHSDPTGLCAEDECGDDDPGGFEDGGMQVENNVAFDAGLIASVTATATPDPDDDPGPDPGDGNCWFKFLCAGAPMFGEPPNSFFIVPQPNGPVIRVFDDNGNIKVDIHYQGNHPEIGNPHLHLPKGQGGKGISRTPKTPIWAPPEPVVPPNTVPYVQYSPWPRQATPVIPIPGPSLTAPMLPIIINPCLLSSTYNLRVCSGGRGAT
jgi:hypothetical protein